MKKYFNRFFGCAAVVAAVVMSVVACVPMSPEDEEQAGPRILASTSELDFDWVYCEQSFDVSSPEPFEVTTDADWLMFDQTEFDMGDYAVIVAAGENPSEEVREAVIRLVAADLDTVEIAVLQAASEPESVLRVERRNVEINSDAQTVELKVNSGMPFAVSSNSKWAVVSSEKFPAGGSVVVPVAVERNVEDKVRQAKLTLLSDSGSKAEVVVTQSEFNPSMSVAVDTLTIDAESGQVRFVVNSDVDFTVSSQEDWVMMGEGFYLASAEAEVVVDVKRNNHIAPRVAELNIVGVDAAVSCKVYVAQEAKVVSNTNAITKISLLKKLNPSLDKDYVMTPDEKGVFSCYIPAKKEDAYLTISGANVRFDRITPFDIENVVVTFETDAERVYVDNKVLTSGESKCDLSTYKTFKAVAESGAVRDYSVQLTYFTGLPIIYIDLDSNKEVASKEVYEYGTVRIVGAGNVPGLPEQRFEVHGRGNSSWGTFRKKPSYTFKLDKAQEVGGMPEHKKWVMIGNYRDKTLLRNEVAWWCSQRLPGLAWTPRYQQMELVLNGLHRGVYQVAEQVRIGKNRVNIAEMSPTDTQGEAITGGYIVEFHYGSDAQQWCWDMPYLRGNSGASVKQPKIDDSNTAQRDYIMNYVMTIDNWFASGENLEELMETYIDIPSWVAQWLVFEISGTTEPQGPNSWYTYKQRGDDKWYCGPAWDFDYKSYRPSEGKRWTNAAVMYLPEMLRYRPYKDELVRQWRTYLEPILPDLLQYIEERRDVLRRSAEANWSIHDQNLIDDGRRENGDEQIPWDDALDRMIQYLEYKWEFMSQNITNL